MALVYGDDDFEKSIGIAVCTGYDTDCNCATVGSIMGMILGAEAMPEKWVKPLNNRFKTSIGGEGIVNISDMAKRTMKVMEKMR